ncbi:unnamed protein product, partial [Phaeothamnion confervicola]
ASAAERKARRLRRRRRWLLPRPRGSPARRKECRALQRRQRWRRLARCAATQSLRDGWTALRHSWQILKQGRRRTRRRGLPLRTTSSARWSGTARWRLGRARRRRWRRSSDESVAGSCRCACRRRGLPDRRCRRLSLRRKRRGRWRRRRSRRAGTSCWGALPRCDAPLRTLMPPRNFYLEAAGET